MLLQSAVGGAAMEGFGPGHFGEIPMDGEFDQTGDIVDVELAHHTGAVGIDRFGTDRETRGDFLGAEPLDEHGKNLMLASAKGFDGVVIEFATALVAEYLLNLDRGRDVDATFANLAERIEELLSGTGLKNEALCAAAERLDDRLPVGTGGHEDHSRFARGLANAPEQFERMDFREIQIEQRDVRFQFQYEPEGGGAVGAVGDDDETAAVGAERGKRFAHEREGFRD